MKTSRYGEGLFRIVRWTTAAFAAAILATASPVAGQEASPHQLRWERGGELCREGEPRLRRYVVTRLGFDPFGAGPPKAGASNVRTILVDLSVQGGGYRLTLVFHDDAGNVRSTRTLESASRGVARRRARDPKLARANGEAPHRHRPRRPRHRSRCGDDRPADADADIDDEPHETARRRPLTSATTSARGSPRGGIRRRRRDASQARPRTRNRRPHRDP